MKGATIVRWVDALGAPAPTLADALALFGPEVDRDVARDEVIVEPADPAWSEVVVELDGEDPPGWAGVRHSFDPHQRVGVEELEEWLGPARDPGPIVDAFDARPRRMQFIVRRGEVDVTVIATPASVEGGTAHLSGLIVRRVEPLGLDDDEPEDDDHEDVR